MLASAALTSMQIPVDEMQFSALSCGDVSDPLVVFLHGFPQFADVWSELLPHVAAAGYFALAFDQRGYSTEAQPQPVAMYEIHHLVDDVRRIALYFGRTRFHLVGHDWGGMVAWWMAAEFPEAVASLVVLSSPHPSALGRALRSDLNQLKRSLYIPFFKFPFGVAETPLRFQNGFLLKSIFRKHLSQEMLERNTKRLLAGFTLTNALKWYRATWPTSSMGIVTTPTLYIWGSADQALGQRAAQLTGEYVEGKYQFELLKGSSHWLLEDQPCAIRELLLNHLDQN